MNESLFQSLSHDLGHLTWPLGLCAFISLLIILERLTLIVHEQCKSNNAFKQLQGKQAAINESYILQTIPKLKQSQSLSAKGAALLLIHRHEEKSARDNILSLWLAQQQEQRKAGIKLLQIIATVAPLMGLLGTVLGLIDMFAELAQTTGPITPAKLSSGLALAMNTTAAGLIIAIPAVIFAQLVNLWAEKSCNDLAYQLNQLNLWLDGMANAPEQAQQEPVMGLAQAGIKL